MDLDSMYIRDGVLPGEIKSRQLGKIGVNLVENAVLSELGWLFAHNTLENDYGIDAYIERRETFVENGKEKIAIYGKIIALQIKSTDDEEAQDGYYRVFFSEAQNNYWDKHTLPILFVLVNRKDKECYWQEFKKELVEINEQTTDVKKKYYIDIPTSQKLDKNHKHQITIIAETGKQNKLKTYLNHLELMEMIDSGKYELKAIFNNETTEFNQRYLGRVDTMSRKWTKKIEIFIRTLPRFRLLASQIN